MSGAGTGARSGAGAAPAPAEVAGSLDPIGPADLLRLARTDAERALDRAVVQLHAAARSGLPELGDRTTVAWPAPIRPDAFAEAVALLRAAGHDVVEDREGAWSSVESVESALHVLADLHDHLVMARHERCQVALVEVRGTCRPGPFRHRTAWVTVEGEATFDGVAAGLGQAVALRGGADAEVIPTATWRGLRLDLVAFGPDDLAGQLRRQVAFSPLARADLPLELTAPYRSYGGTLLDGPDRLAAEVADLASDSLRERALAWWHAHLRLHPAPAPDPGAEPALAFAAAGLPAFVDDAQSASAPQFASILAAGGHLIPLTAAHLDQVVALATGSVDGDVPALDADLAAALALAGLLRPT